MSPAETATDANDMTLDPPGTIVVVGAGALGIEAALYGRYLGYNVTLIEAQDDREEALAIALSRVGAAARALLGAGLVLWHFLDPHLCRRAAGAALRRDGRCAASREPGGLWPQPGQTPHLAHNGHRYQWLLFDRLQLAHLFPDLLQ